MRPESIPILLIPGLGADARMFRKQVPRFPQARVLELAAPRGGETLPAYVRRFAKRLPPPPYILAGASFGGIVARELCRHGSPTALILMESLEDSAELRQPWRALCALPRPVLGLAIGAMRVPAPLLGMLPTGGSIPLIARMVADTDAALLAWGINVIASQVHRAPIAVPTLRLHGTRDAFLKPAPGARVTWIRGAGHLMNLSHPRATNRHIAAFLQGVVPVA